MPLPPCSHSVAVRTPWHKYEELRANAAVYKDAERDELGMEYQKVVDRLRGMSGEEFGRKVLGPTGLGMAEGMAQADDG
jgi:hypothetical protein